MGMPLEEAMLRLCMPRRRSHRSKGANAECKASYKKELALGNYDGTIDGDTQLRQEYRKGDSEFCGSRKDADLSKPCRLY
jgi:hypothetical protein